MVSRTAKRRAAKQNVQATRWQDAKWQEECAVINRQKGKQRWWMSFRRRCMIVGSVMVLVHLALGGWWLFYSGQVQSAYVAAQMWVGDQTKLAGFEVRRIEIEGLKKLEPMLIVDAMQIKVGDPILPLSIHELKTKLETLPEIRHARVERQLPDSIFVSVVEREGAAIWQYQSKHQLIDWDGTVLANQEREANKHYLIVVGADAPEHAPAFLAMLKATPDLMEKVVAGKRVGSRRWDVSLQNGLVVKLPQDGADAAWKRFATMVRDERLLDRAIQAIDMRIEDRLFMAIDPAIKDSPAGVVQPTLTSARDT